MPLKKGKSQETVGKNIKELEHSYKKTGKIGTSKPKSKKAAHKQAVAIALNMAGKSKVKKESYDELVNNYLKTYLLEMDVRQDPREGFDGDPFVDPTEDLDADEGCEDVSIQDMYKAVARKVGARQVSMMSGEEIKDAYYHMTDSASPAEGSEEECEDSCEDGCQCDRCKGGSMLKFYGFEQ